MELIYKINDKPPTSKMMLAALQQLLAVLAGTITMPMIVGHGMSHSAALLGAGVGSIVYFIITRFRSPAFLGSSFSYVGSLSAAFAGAATVAMGYVGLILGATISGLIYVILSIVIKFAGTKWIEKIMPAIIIGPVVMVIGLVLAPEAVTNLFLGGVTVAGISIANQYVCLVCGLVALFTSVLVSVYGKNLIKLIPFIFGILTGYFLALILSIFGYMNDVDALKIVDFSIFKNIEWLPELSFVKAIDGFKDFSSVKEFFSYFGLVVSAYLPIAFVSFAEHIADHKNLSFITGQNLIEDPGLHRTLLGDGLGSITGAFLGGCPNTTYGESISCIAFSHNASIWTLLSAAIMAVVLSFIGPLMCFFQSVPPCVIGGISFALFGFIAASGLQMLKGVDFSKSKNIFVIAAILVGGVGGLTLQLRNVVISPVACALLLGVVINLIVNIKMPKKDKDEKS